MIAIHHRQNSFSNDWIEYCKLHDVGYKTVDCYNGNIIEQLADCDGLMWHWAHYDCHARLFALQLTQSLEVAGKKVFPNTATCWHYDDKVGQKYLLEAIGAPLVPTYVFYDKTEALRWIQTTDFPKVFKLRGGASSINVRLVKTRYEADGLVRQAFGRGFPPVNRRAIFKDKLELLRRNAGSHAFRESLKAAALCIIPGRAERRFAREKGYVYFQDYLSNNVYDTRLVVIGKRCFGVRRHCRKGDFRASGSGLLEYDPALFEPETINIAFCTARKLGTQSLAFDLLSDEKGKPKIGEISYCFPTGSFLEDCPGYWEESINWVEKKVKPAYCMIEDFITAFRK